MLRVYYADISGLELRPALAWLSDYRRKRLEQVKNELAQKQGAGAELLLNYAVRELWPETELPLELFADEYGKPHLGDGRLCFSLSHSGAYSLCAVSDRDIGADIQRQKTFNERLARRFFSEEELRHILSADDRDHAFTKVWALKESYIKAVGLGLKMPLDSFSLSFGEKIGVRGEEHCLWHEYSRDYHMALCATGVEKPEFFREISSSRLLFG